MIKVNTILNVADNSGAIRVKCIHVLEKGTGCYTGALGDVIVISIVEATPTAKVKKGEVKRALIVRTKSPIRRSDGSQIAFSDNAVVLLNDQQDIIATRVMGIVPREIKELNAKIVSIAKGVI